MLIKAKTFQGYRLDMVHAIPTQFRGQFRGHLTYFAFRTWFLRLKVPAKDLLRCFHERIIS